MKKIILLISLVSLLFISCENSLSKIENPSLVENSTNTPAVTTSPSEDGKTYITFGDISFENESRTINPVYNRDHLTALYIKGMETNKVTPTTKPNDYTTLFGLYSDNPKATSYDDLCTKKFEVIPGIWNFILYATLYDFEFSGMTTVEVKPGMTHSLNFTLTTTNTSLYPYGIIDITVDFTGNADRVVATLKEKSTSTTARITKTYTPTDTKNPISTVEGETFKRINFKTANSSSSSSGGVTAGKYYLLFEFFQNGFDEPINTVENIVRVENNFTTKKTLNLDLDELYTITYSYWEGTAGFDTTELESLSFDPATTVLPSVYSRKSETFTLPTPSLPGYTFDAWYKDTDFTEENKITQITQGSTGDLELYANFVAQGGSGNSFFVDPDANNDEESGLDASHPLKTIMAAIGKMNDSNVDYVINVMGDLFQANFSEEYKLELTEDINGKAKSITFKGNADSGTYDIDGQSGGDPTTVMKVTTSVPIIIEGITVTGGCADSSHLGGAIYIGEESTVILGQDTIVNGGGSHGCGSAIYVAASENGGVTKAGTLIMKDNAVVNADDFGEVYLCTGATIKVASALTGQSSVYDSNISQNVTSPIVAKITPQVYAENIPVITLTDDAPDTLNISDVYEKFAVFGTEAVSCSITNEGKLSISSVTLKTGTAINTIFQKLGGQENPVITDNGTATSDTTITAFAKSTTAPSSAEYYLDENSIIPVWLDGTTIKYYKPEGITLYLNSDSSYMFCQLKNITSIDTTDLNTSNVTNMYCLFNSCEKLSTVDLSSFDTSKVTNMAGMFGNCTALSSVDLSSFNTQNVTTMCNMFVSCKGLTVLDFSSFDTRSLENTAGLVGHMTNLTKIYVDPDKWNMTKVTESTSMFWECQNLVGGNGTTCSNANSNVSYAHVDVEGNPGYLTDIADKPAASNDFTTITGATIAHVAGSNENDGDNTNVIIPNLYVANALVTKSEYEEYMDYYGTNRPTGNADTPVYYVSWIDAIIYCNLRSIDEGKQPVYSLNGETNPDSSTWTAYGVTSNEGFYWYNSNGDSDSWDSDSAFDFNLDADGYRLMTGDECEYIKENYPSIFAVSTMDEWTQTFNFEPAAYRLYYSHSEGTCVGKLKGNATRENTLGFRVVRKAGANGGSNP